MKKMLFLAGLALSFLFPPQTITAAHRTAAPKSVSEASVSNKKSERKLRKWQQRMNRFERKMEKRMERWERKGKLGGSFNLGGIGLVVLLLGALFVGLGLLIPVVGIVFIIIGAIIGFVGLLLMLILSGFNVETN